MANTINKRFIYEHELTLYPFAPLGLIHNQGEWPNARYHASLVVFIKQDDETIIPWLTYYKSLGFDHVYLYYSGDAPFTLYRKLLPFIVSDDPFVTFHPYRFDKEKNAAYLHFLYHHLTETEWHLVMDNHDLLHFEEDKSIKDFLLKFRGVDVIYFNLFLHGSHIISHNSINTIRQENFSGFSPVQDTPPFTRMMVRSKIFPYQQAFTNDREKIYYEINSLDPDLKSQNVIKENMKHYFINFPSNIIINQIKNNHHRRKMILDTAYILRFDASFSNPSNQRTDATLDYFDRFYFTSDTEVMTEADLSKTILQKSNYLQNAQKKHIHASEKQYVFPKIQTPLISKGKPCTQSSTRNNKSSKSMAQRLVSGELKGRIQTVTQAEESPWWEIDLEAVYLIKEIILFNGLNAWSDSLTHFQIASSKNHQDWIIRYEKQDNSYIGGADGKYFRRVHPLVFPAQWIRITVPGTQKVFSLDQVQIFGNKL